MTELDLFIDQVKRENAVYNELSRLETLASILTIVGISLILAVVVL